MQTARIYADHAASTPLRPEVLEAMLPCLQGGFNPSSIHEEGRRARRVVDDARATVAHILGAQPREIIFTSGGSEADNLAIFGIATARQSCGKHIVTSAIEHHAVLQAGQRLSEDGWEVTILDADQNGLLDLAAFTNALSPRTALATVMLANNEIGTVLPVADLASIAHRHGVTFHSDAVQAPAYLRIDVNQLGVDALSVSAHKFYGPKGIGALYVRNGTPLRSQLVGGSQERAQRAGTENVAGIAGMAKALALADEERAELSLRLDTLRAEFEERITARIADVRINGAGARRLPHISSVSFAGVEAHALVIRLDLEGVAISAGSACAAGASEPSHVISALYPEQRWKRGAVRFSFGHTTSAADIERLCEIVVAAVADLRGVSVEALTLTT